MFAELAAIIRPHAARLEVKQDTPTDLYVDTRHVQKNGKPLLFGAVQVKKDRVSFHPMPVYLQPALLDGISPALRKRMHGKSCFNFAAVDKALFKELAALAQAGYASYRAQGYAWRAAIACLPECANVSKTLRERRIRNIWRRSPVARCWMTTQADIMALERSFWQCMVEMEVDAAISLLDERSVAAGARGIRHFDPAGYRAMALAGDARMTSFEFSDERVVFPTPDVAIASYKARQSFTTGGQHHEMLVYDTTTWVRKNGRWLACVHTETPAEEDPPAGT